MSSTGALSLERLGQNLPVKGKENRSMMNWCLAVRANE